MKRLFHLVAIAAFFVVLVGGSLIDPDRSSSAYAQNIRPDVPLPNMGFALTSVVWPIAPIPTCWDMQVQAFNNYAAQREVVRQAVANTWEAASLIRFVGWDRCTGQPNQGITIVVNQDGPLTHGLGMQLKNETPSMQLNFEFTQWSHEYCENRVDECIRVIAVHEFGHVLGFAHEQNRPDTPEKCALNEAPQGENGNLTVGAWDLSSVMNYCNPKWNGDGTLSATDVEMVRRFYGDPTADTSIDIFDESGKLLTVVQ